MKRVGFPWDVDDRYNSVLSCLIQNGCKKLRLENWHIVSPKLFWAPNDRSLGFPFWPRLQTIDIDMAVVTHEGNVFFEPDPEDKNYPELCRRMNDAAGSQDTGLYVAPPIQINCIPVPGIMNPLLIAIAGAIQRASCLEALNLELLSWSCRDLLSDVQSVTAHVKFQITYLVKGVLSRDQNGDEIDGPVGKTRLFWKTGKWRPDEEVQKAFREALVKDALILYD